MKNVYLTLTVLIAIGMSACKKNYDCTAVTSSGVETVFQCEHCTKNDASDYEQTILDKGYTKATCETK